MEFLKKETMDVGCTVVSTEWEVLVDQTQCPYSVWLIAAMLATR